MDAFADRLQRLREQRHISRRTLSELCGLRSNAVRLYERGEAMPRMDSLIALADYFEVTIDFLVGRDG